MSQPFDSRLAVTAAEFFANQALDKQQEAAGIAAAVAASFATPSGPTSVSSALVTATGSTTARTMADVSADAILGSGKKNYQQSAGIQIVDFANGESWTFSGTAGGSLTMLSSPKIQNFDRSMRLVANASAGATARSNYTSPALTMMGPNGWFMFAVYPEVVTTNDLFSLILYDGTNSPAGAYNNYQSLLPGVWNYVLIEASSFSPAITSGLAQTLTRIEITSGQGGSSYIFGGVWYVPKSRPKVIVGFDDAWSSQYTEAFAYMQTKPAMPGTIYTIAAKVGTAGYCTLAQLAEMYRSGWDLGVHGDYQHNAAPLNNDLTLITNDVRTNRDYLVAQGFARASTHYAYPGGSVGTNSLAALQSLGFVTSRGTLFDPIPMAPFGLANPLRLTGTSFSQQTGVAVLEARIDTAIKTGSALMLYAHQIVTPVTDAPNQITPTDFRTVIDYLATKQAAGLVDMVSISDWYNGLRVYAPSP